MSMSVGASSSNALSYLQSLMQQGTSGAKEAKKSSASDPLAMLMQAISGGDESAVQTNAAAPSPAGKGVTSQPFSADTMSALLSAQGEQPSNSPSAKLFSKLDADNDGKISKTEFDAAARKAGADSAVADAVFAKIDSDSDGNVSHVELGKADHGGHRHHHVDGGAPPAVPAQDVPDTANSGGGSYESGILDKSAANLLDQLIKLQSQVLKVASSTMSAVA